MVLYTQPGCPKCDLAKEKLAEAHIPFTVCNDAKLALSYGIKIVPALQHNDTIYTFKEILQMCNEKGVK